MDFGADFFFHRLISRMCCLNLFVYSVFDMHLCNLFVSPSHCFKKKKLWVIFIDMHLLEWNKGCI